MPKAYRKKTFKRRTFAKKRTYKRKVVKRPSFAKKVLQVVRKNEETKIVVYAGAVACGNYAALGNSLVQFPVSLNSTTLIVAQGNGLQDREGLKIKIKKVIFRGVIYPGAQNGTTNAILIPYDVRVLIGKNKLTPQNAMPVATMFQTGNTNISPQGSLIDVMLPLNAEAITKYKDKTFKVGLSSVGPGSYLGAGYNNNDYKYNHKFTWDITKACPSHVQYTGAAAATQTSDISYMMVMPVAADGTNIAASTCTSFAYEVEVHFCEI